MSFTKHVANSLESLYNGEPWMGVTYKEHLVRIDADLAVKRFGESNCIWQIVSHVIYWHQRVTRYMHNDPPEQDGDLPDFYLPDNHGPDNWHATLGRLEHSFRDTAATIRAFPEAELFDAFPGTDNPAIYYLQGLAEHDAYHLGQIVLLHKYA
ncbi:DinB family protein [Chitinophaga sp. Cy-1792]|uniref:DinB family protein n=1 Tax=Chitinophaga sp. Cy-1792 TaxID=2608339 RepID=UPI0014206378|nr:DinB family protein [Chitinophaga sp. Cy-1792]NIG56358.1 DinB family protein [Chitinophaga sp. Cy-1792]